MGVSKDPSDFEGMIQFLLENEQQEKIPAEWVPSSTYWLVSDQKRVIGVVNIRHGLTETLFNCGGHIGYGIRPSERRKGVATKLLALALEKTKELGSGESLLYMMQTIRLRRKRSSIMVEYRMQALHMKTEMS